MGHRFGDGEGDAVPNATFKTPPIERAGKAFLQLPFGLFPPALISGEGGVPQNLPPAVPFQITDSRLLQVTAQQDGGGQRGIEQFLGSEETALGHPAPSGGGKMRSLRPNPLHGGNSPAGNSPQGQAHLSHRLEGRDRKAGFDRALWGCLPEDGDGL